MLAERSCVYSILIRLMESREEGKERYINAFALVKHGGVNDLLSRRAQGFGSTLRVWICAVSRWRTRSTQPPAGVPGGQEHHPQGL